MRGSCIHSYGLGNISVQAYSALCRNYWWLCPVLLSSGPFPLRFAVPPSMEITQVIYHYGNLCNNERQGSHLDC
jgi:hypothetical protein